MHWNWNRTRIAAILVFCLATATGGVRSYLQGTAGEDAAFLYAPSQLVEQAAPETRTTAQEAAATNVEEGMEETQSTQAQDYAAQADAPNGRIDLNTATAEELCTLKGIGPVKAQAILDYRSQYGKFVCIEEIMEVKGIGEGTYKKIKDDICVLP